MKKIIKNIIEDQDDNNIALTSESSKPLLYKDLKSLVSKIASQLAGNGISNKEQLVSIEKGIIEQQNEIATFKKMLESEQFQQVAIALAEKGYWVFRMGKAVEDVFNVEHPRVIDYAQSNERSDFLDIWLMANCYFCITCLLYTSPSPRDS